MITYQQIIKITLKKMSKLNNQYQFGNSNKKFK